VLWVQQQQQQQQYCNVARCASRNAADCRCVHRAIVVSAESWLSCGVGAAETPAENATTTTASAAVQTVYTFTQWRWVNKAVTRSRPKARPARHYHHFVIIFGRPCLCRNNVCVCRLSVTHVLWLNDRSYRKLSEKVIRVAWRLLCGTYQVWPPYNATVFPNGLKLFLLTWYNAWRDDHASCLLH